VFAVSLDVVLLIGLACEFFEMAILSWLTSFAEVHGTVIVGTGSRMISTGSCSD